MIHAVLCANDTEMQTARAFYESKGCTVHVYGPSVDITAERVAADQFAVKDEVGPDAYLVVAFKGEAFAATS